METDYLACKTLTCGSMEQHLTPGLALAVIDYHAKDVPGYELSWACERCTRTTAYTRDEVLARIAREKRPKPLPHDHFWAWVLFEFKTALSAEQRTFLGDRVLVERLFADPDKSWYGAVQSTTPYAPLLAIGDHVSGRPWGSYEQCRVVIQDGKEIPITRPDRIMRTSCYAIFVSDQREGADPAPQCANVSCSNPSCGFVYGTMTLEKFKKLAAPAPAAQSFYNTGDRPIMTLHCERCDTMTLIDERSFEGLYQGDLSSFKK